ncbi:MAG: type II toxin-antitoxin system RelE/ParE family toxin [Clostridia bacterium]|nr:type II toxin-antitoxin system RelE/ParE family toxin [Clostridia bacterium]
MFEINYEFQAKLDIEKIEFYIKYFLLNSKVADQIANGISNQILNLKNFPYIGKCYLDNQNRYLIYKNFYIFYEIQENNKIINIKRILHKNNVVF